MVTGQAVNRSPRVFGFWTCLALVVGNMIGSGVYLLPASLASFGWNGVFGWLVTIAGALCLAAVFGTLSTCFPRAGGPYAYSREAFGPFVGFLVAWSYWVSLWVGNVAIATGVVAPLTSLVPDLRLYSVPATIGLVWSLTAANCYDAKLVGRVQIVTTIVKFLPLLAVVLLAAFILTTGRGDLPAIRGDEIRIGGQTGIAAAAAITLWAFLGLESATIPAEKVTNPGRIIFKATLIGTALTGALYLFAASSVALLIPAEEVVGSGAPMADFVRPYWGSATATIIALAAAISAFGALNGWILLQGEMPWAMARDGVFPRWLANSSPRGTPVRAHLVSSSLLTLVLLLNQSRTLADLFGFLILLATLAALLPFLVCSLAALRLRAAGRLPPSVWLIPVALLGTIYSTWTIWGSGIETLTWGAVLLALGVPIYLTMRRSVATPQDP